jgi:hypothetical protein
MPPSSEVKMIFDPPFKELNIALKWNLDATPLLCRELYSSSLTSLTPVNSKAPLLVGGSNTIRLNKAFHDMRVNTSSLDNKEGGQSAGQQWRACCSSSRSSWTR